jgi:hypothetical protein
MLMSEYLCNCPLVRGSVGGHGDQACFSHSPQTQQQFLKKTTGVTNTASDHRYPSHHGGNGEKAFVSAPINNSLSYRMTDYASDNTSDEPVDVQVPKASVSPQS